MGTNLWGLRTRKEGEGTEGMVGEGTGAGKEWGRSIQPSATPLTVVRDLGIRMARARAYTLGLPMPAVKEDDVAVEFGEGAALVVNFKERTA